MKKLKMKFPVICKSGEVANNYREYLDTGHWQDVRKRYRESKLNKGKCVVCERKDKPLDLHHKTYKRLGNEYLRDFIYLCRDCHEKTHEVYKNPKTKTANYRSSLWTAHKKLKRKKR